ncbi:MAG: hypothetical protein M3Y91_14925, partial [Actinomycetota bacterium]|nr:hypothetical protein [Actinomycetota bacterium]
AGPLPGAVERILDAYGRPLSANEIADHLREGGRATTVDALARALRAKRFACGPDAALRLADWDVGASSPAPPSPPVPVSPSETMLSADGRLWLWVRVDAEVLCGGEAVVPGALTAGLGMTAPTRRTFSSRYGPIVLACDGPQPTRGSLRAVAMAAGARVGHTVLLGFSEGGDVHVDVRCATGPMDSAAAKDSPSPLVPHLVVGGTP